MSIAIISTGPDYCDPIGNQIFQSPYILILNCETFEYDVLRNPLALRDEMQNKVDFILLLIRRKVSNVLVQRCTADLRTLLGNHRIDVIESVTGRVGDVMIRIRRGSPKDKLIFEEPS